MDKNLRNLERALAQTPDDLAVKAQLANAKERVGDCNERVYFKLRVVNNPWSARPDRGDFVSCNSYGPGPSKRGSAFKTRADAIKEALRVRDRYPTAEIVLLEYCERTTILQQTELDLKIELSQLELRKIQEAKAELLRHEKELEQREQALLKKIGKS